MKELLSFSFWAALGGFLGPLYMVAIIYILIRYKAYTRKNIASLLIALAVSLVAYIISNPKQRIFLLTYNGLMIVLICIVAVIVKLKNILDP
jgi:hypothetical protein